MIIEFLWILAGVVYIAARWIKETSIPMRVQEYDEAHGFNKGRQSKLERMATSEDPAERMEFARLCGYTHRGEYERKMAVREISIREGWRYFDPNEVSCDPVYVKINGGKYPEWRNPVLLARSWKEVEDKAKEHIAEVDRRKGWIARCPHGDEVDIFPMDYETEEDYQDAVKMQCLRQEKEEKVYKKYATYRNGDSKTFLASQIDNVESKWEENKKYFQGAILGAYMCDIVVVQYKKTNSHIKSGLKIVREKCRMEGIDWIDVINESKIGSFIMEFTQ